MQRVTVLRGQIKPSKHGTLEPGADCRKQSSMSISRDSLAIHSAEHANASPVEWRVESGLVDYPAAVAFMEARVAAIAAGQAPELVWLVEHPALYTAGTSADASDLVDATRFPVHRPAVADSTPITAPASAWPT